MEYICIGINITTLYKSYILLFAVLFSMFSCTEDPELIKKSPIEGTWSYQRQMNTKGSCIYDSTYSTVRMIKSDTVNVYVSMGEWRITKIPSRVMRDSFLIESRHKNQENTFVAESRLTAFVYEDIFYIYDTTKTTAKLSPERYQLKSSVIEADKMVLVKNFDVDTCKMESYSMQLKRIQ